MKTKHILQYSIYISLLILICYLLYYQFSINNVNNEQFTQCAAPAGQEKYMYYCPRITDQRSCDAHGCKWGGGATPSPPSPSFPTGGGATPFPHGGGATPGPHGGGATPFPTGGGATPGPHGGGATPFPTGGGATPAPHGGGATPAPHGAGNYMYATCPASIKKSDADALKGKPSQPLCPDYPDYCPTSTFIEAGTPCKGYVGSKCDKGRQQFVKDFVKSCNGDDNCQNACLLSH